MQTDGDGRVRRRKDHKELRDTLQGAEGLLRAGKAREADVVLKRAGVKAAAMWGGVGVPALPQAVRDLISLSAHAQNLVARADGAADTGPLVERLVALRSVIEREAAREGEASPASPPG